MDHINGKPSVTSVRCKTVTTGLSSACVIRLLDLSAVRNDWQGDSHTSLWSPKSTVMTEAQSTMTGEAWPLDLQDITGASEHVSIGGWRLGECLGWWKGGWCGETFKAGVGDGCRAWCLWGTHRGQAVLVVIKGDPIKCSPGPWLHCQAVRKRMHGGGDAGGYLKDKSHIFLWRGPLNISVKWNLWFKSIIHTTGRYLRQ